MDLFSYHRAYRESLGVFEALRRLGFSSDDIYFMVAGANEQGPKQTVMVLRTQGKEFKVITGYLEGSVEEIQDTWVEIATALNDKKIPQEQLDASWRSCMLYLRAAEFVAALVKKGFELPKVQLKLSENKMEIN